MYITADLHIHSKYARAVSKYMDLVNIEQVGRQKGISVLGTGDWTHPQWFNAIQKELVETEEGLFTLRSALSSPTRFLLSVEIASIYSEKGKTHRIHNLVFVPNLETAQKVEKALLSKGCTLHADGRPIIGLSAKHLLELLLSIDDRILLIPCHIWTPWFSLFGAHSGYETFEECFGEVSSFVYGIETGLSSDPEMNWQIPDLDSKTILSFSDAHSLPKIGREVTVFSLSELSYPAIREAIMSQTLKMQGKPFRSSVAYTVEFYPEEGKYHYDGHRNCGVILTPEQSRNIENMCPACKRKLTIGVLHRIEDLQTRKKNSVTRKDNYGVMWIEDAMEKHPPFTRMVPLLEIVAQSLGMRVESNKVQALWLKLCQSFESEIAILLTASLEALTIVGGENLARAINKVRQASIHIEPGYDNVYGIVDIYHKQGNAQLPMTFIKE